MKKIFTLVALGAATAVLVWCFAKKDAVVVGTNLPAVSGEVAAEATIPSDQPYEYINKEKWFSFMLPATWTFQENVFGALVMLFAPQEKWDTIKENIGVTTTELTGNIQLSSYFELAKGIAESVISNYKIEKEEAITINGESAMKVIYQGVQGGENLQREQVVVLKWKTAYVLTYTATEKTFNDLLAGVDNIINTFTIN